MVRHVKTAGVLGAGVMGMGIAAHLANAGVKVHLLDIVPKGKDGDLPEDPKARDVLAAGAVARAARHKPKPFASPERARLVTPGNLEDHLDRLAECDWVIEAVIEHPGIKRQLFAKVGPHLADHAALTSNTSGIPLADLTREMPEELKKRFFITHFFNPARYMRLLEVVPGPDTDPELVESIAAFSRGRLGKGVVRAKDTPNFIGNRIGAGAMMMAVQLLDEGYGIEEIDAVAGPPLGKPKSAVFRTADLVGLDTLKHVIANCYEALEEDEARHIFKAPDHLVQMIERGWTGDKARQGYYKKTRAGGKKVILALNTRTMEYGERQKVRFDSIGKVRNIDDAGKRITMMLAADDRGGEIARRLMLPALAYAANRIPEISDTIEGVDRALRWGFNWDLGPFETLDAIGLTRAIALMEEAGVEVPELLRKVAAGPGSFYSGDASGKRVFDPTTGERVPLGPESPGEIRLAEVKASSGGLVHKDVSASLLDIGDGAFCLEFHAKMNAIDDSVVAMLGRAVAHAEREGVGLVIANEGPNFSVGANLMLIGMAAMQKQWERLGQIVDQFQGACRGLRRSAIPVVAAPFGLTLGGGLEVCLGADAVQAHLECYHGLVEVGVGLIPGGGGTKEVLVRLLENLPPGSVEPFDLVRKAFESIGMAKVAESAEEGRAAGYMRRSDGISFNRSDLTAHAKGRVLGMARSGYAPPPDPVLVLPGREGIANLTVGIQGFVWAGQISEHDALIGRKLAHVLSGGDVAPGTAVSEDRLLELEREAFLSLCGEPKTQERIQHMLMKGKPLRN